MGVARPELTAWSFANRTRVNLGRVGLVPVRADGTAAVEADLTGVRQELDPWTGTLSSAFKVDGVAAMVRAACHPDVDGVAVRVESPLVPAVALRSG